MVKIQLLKEGARLPERKTDGAAGYDLYAPQDVKIQHGRNLVKLGFAMEIPTGYYARIVPRSGFSVKGMGEGRYNADVIEGTVDEDYRGEIGVIVNNNDRPFFLHKNTRIAQMIFCRYRAPDLRVVDELETTERGDGGFGHTGSN